MRWALAALALWTSAAAGAEASPPSNQALVFYNARIAQREDRANDVLKLWLLRNSLHQRGESSPHDEEFRSVVWAALGALAICPDGFPRDNQGGAGLWPIGLHNWVVQSMARSPAPDHPAPFGVFPVGMQQRFISLNDVLSAEELRSVTFFRSACFLPQLTMLELGEVPWTDLSDRLNAGRMMRHLLELSKQTLVRAKVQNLAAIDARIFDLDLVLAELHSRRARREARATSQEARSLGVSEGGAEELRSALMKWPEDSPQKIFLRKSLTWSAEEWLTLSRDRRLFLFLQAKAVSDDPEKLEQQVLSVIDALIDSGEGEELESWIGMLEVTPKFRAVVTSGERGRRLLELEPESGFRERTVVALQRGVTFLEAGDLRESLRSFAFAMKYAETSREAHTSMALARRWLSYVLSRYETNQEVIDTLKALVPRQEYNRVVEDLVWRAALHADLKSFKQVVASVKRGGSFDAGIARLRPLAEGNTGALATGLRTALEEEPYSALRFVRQLVEKLESEDGDVRRAHLPTVKQLISLLETVAKAPGKPTAHSRIAEELRGRAEAILEGLSHLEVSADGKIRALSPAHEAFAGSIRLAPSDPLPWPFHPPQPEAPSAFIPFVLVPIEWRDESGARVFGWRITE